MAAAGLAAAVRAAASDAPTKGRVRLGITIAQL